MALKIAVVWNHRSRLLDCSFRFEQYVAGFRALGHEPVVVCDFDSAAGFDGPLEVADSADRFRQEGFWRSVAADVAVIVTWHRMSEVLRAIRAAGTRVVAIADTDGLLGVRTSPWKTLEQRIVYRDGFAAKAKLAARWALRYLAAVARVSADDREHLASTRSSNAVVMGSGQAAANFRAYLARHGQGSLGGRVHIVPFTVGETFLACPVPETKAPRVVAIGRWSDPQKDAGRLAAALERFLDRRPERDDLEIVLLGEGGERWFAPLARAWPAVYYAGVRRQAEVARTLAAARAIVFASRWEGSPHSALEALAVGATLVGPALPSLASWCDGGRFGTVTPSRRAGALARALEREMAAWDDGRRRAGEISRCWRERLAPEAVCGELLESAFGRL